MMQKAQSERLDSHSVTHQNLENVLSDSKPDDFLSQPKSSYILYGKNPSHPSQSSYKKRFYRDNFYVHSQGEIAQKIKSPVFQASQVVQTNFSQNNQSMEVSKYQTPSKSVINKSSQMKRRKLYINKLQEKAKEYSRFQKHKNLRQKFKKSQAHQLMKTISTRQKRLIKNPATKQRFYIQKSYAKKVIRKRWKQFNSRRHSMPNKENSTKQNLRFESALVKGMVKNPRNENNFIMSTQGKNLGRSKVKGKNGIRKVLSESDFDGETSQEEIVSSVSKEEFDVDDDNEGLSALIKASASKIDQTGKYKFSSMPKKRVKKRRHKKSLSKTQTASDRQNTVQSFELGNEKLFKHKFFKKTENHLKDIQYAKFFKIQPSQLKTTQRPKTHHHRRQTRMKRAKTTDYRLRQKSSKNKKINSDLILQQTQHLQRKQPKMHPMISKSEKRQLDYYNKVITNRNFHFKAKCPLDIIQLRVSQQRPPDTVTSLVRKKHIKKESQNRKKLIEKQQGLILANKQSTTSKANKDEEANEEYIKVDYRKVMKDELRKSMKSMKWMEFETMDDDRKQDKVRLRRSLMRRLRSKCKTLQTQIALSKYIKSFCSQRRVKAEKMFQQSKAEWLALESRMEIKINECQLADRKDLETKDQFGMPEKQWNQAVEWMGRNEKICAELMKERKATQASSLHIDHDIFRIKQSKLSKTQINEISFTYIRKIHQGQRFDAEKMDEILRDLKFFKKYQKRTQRQLIIRSSKYKLYHRGECIFEQGSKDKKIYIILRGSVNMRQKKMNPLGYEEDLILKVFHDGDFFGQVSMIGKIKCHIEMKQKLQEEEEERLKREKHALCGHRSFKHKPKPKPKPKKRAKTWYQKEAEGIRLNSAIAAEETHILHFNRYLYEKIFLEDMESQLHDRIQVLNRIHLFEKADPMILSPLANFLEKEEYGMGDVIVPSHKVPTKLVIVAQGTASKVIEIIDYKQRKPSIYTRRLQPPLRPFRMHMQSEYKVVDEPQQIFDVKDPLEIGPGQREFPEDKCDFPREVVPELCTKDHIAFKHHVLIKEMTRGGYDCVKPLFIDEYRPVKGLYFKDNEVKPIPWKIIASSSYCQVYTITKERLKLIPDDLRIQLLDGFYKQYMENEQNNAKLCYRIDRQWCRFKEATQDDYLVGQFMERNQGNHNRAYKKY